MFCVNGAENGAGTEILKKKLCDVILSIRYNTEIISIHNFSENMPWKRMPKIDFFEETGRSCDSSWEGGGPNYFLLVYYEAYLLCVSTTGLVVGIPIVYTFIVYSDTCMKLN